MRGKTGGDREDAYLEEDEEYRVNGGVVRVREKYDWLEGQRTCSRPHSRQTSPSIERIEKEKNERKNPNHKGPSQRILSPGSSLTSFPLRFLRFLFNAFGSVFGNSTARTMTTATDREELLERACARNRANDRCAVGHNRAEHDPGQALGGWVQARDYAAGVKKHSRREEE
jgi:hypothetical protein